MVKSGIQPSQAWGCSVIEAGIILGVDFSVKSDNSFMLNSERLANGAPIDNFGNSHG